MSWPSAVVNDGQLITNVPEAGFPFARYTVPWIVVMLTVPWAIVPQPIRTTSNNTLIHLPAHNHFRFVSFICVSSFFLGQLQRARLRSPLIPAKSCLHACPAALSTPANPLKRSKCEGKISVLPSHFTAFLVECS
jgi:hypothetical protein